MGNGIQTPNDARRAGKTAGMDGTKECKSQKPPKGGFLRWAILSTMSDLWLEYVFVLFLQFLLFLIHAAYEKKLAEIPRILWYGALTGLVIGIPSDLLGVKYLGLASYALGLGPLFLIFNGFVGYGIFAANILLMQKARLWHFCVWTIVVTAGFEVTNLFTHSWTYSFPVPSIEYWIVAFGFPLLVAVTIAEAWHFLFKHRFVFIDNVIKRVRLG